ncbi:hypothetical protein L6278_03500 [Candidatus Parcubacteria bacterium]|nr:hypothetical protein [Patescibacteria group bacterium]MBU4482086.1 hypothetical protein [Patescibacteria group bacterium]MCG2687167.1 hypothetical protein [Candidatus Parcubacteria bacterium]
MIDFQKFDVAFKQILDSSTEKEVTLLEIKKRLLEQDIKIDNSLIFNKMTIHSTKNEWSYKFIDNQFCLCRC